MSPRARNVTLLVLIGFVAFLLWSTLSSQRVECAVAVEFQGRADSATASGASEEDAAREAQTAACAQVVGPVESTYRWKGEVERATEWFCHLKTTLARAPGLAVRLRELHPYDTPEIIAMAIVDGDPDYLRWIAESVGDPVAP